MKILITGSSGHLGEAIIRVLQQNGVHDYIGLDLKPSPFTTRVGTLTDRVLVRQCLRGVDVVIHSATLHKPHIATHSNQDFIDTNLTGTLNLLEEAVAQGVRSFIYTSTTSTFGDALSPQAHEPAVWITEAVRPVPKNIYGVTKTAAEDLCQLFYRNHGLPCLVLKVSRFFPEEDDAPAMRTAYTSDNSKANELLFRRVDVADVVSAHLLAVEKAPELGFEKFIISATTPFTRPDLAELHRHAPAVVARLFPDYPGLYEQRNWQLFPRIGRVYVNEKARTVLGWQPQYDFQCVLDCLRDGRDFRSPLAVAVGKKAYHEQQFEDGPYPTHD